MTYCRNHPFVIWAACFLWLISMFSIVWSLLLFFCVGDMLILTGTDLVNAFVLLSGVVMLPTNVHMLYAISHGKKIDAKSKVVCCPLWLCILWIVVINICGAVLCVQKITTCKKNTDQRFFNSMLQYRSVPKHKHFIDNLQWSLRCCGLNSYKDWFTRDWYDKIRDYEWDPVVHKRNAQSKQMKFETDSVPLSCCKSGSCISNYLSELGTYSINTNGCSNMIHRVIIVSMFAHLILFIVIIIIELLLLRYVVKKPKPACAEPIKGEVYNVKHIMKANDNFHASSGSYQMNPEDSDEDSVKAFSVKTNY